MYFLKRTGAGDPDFQTLVAALDQNLALRDGDDHAFYAQFNKIDMIRYVVLVYEGADAVGCGAIKEYEPGVIEVKRMFVPVHKRGQGIASVVLQELETWAAELGYRTCILETGIKQPEAIRLYQKNHYHQIDQYGQYAGVDNSLCFEKELPPPLDH